ncbi:MAG TPA: Gfo/Idh/MocA family oxidoreductase, partial [Beutenbergiaceae bacterium]|nr:Gfo/Idh/MocA family oxidoreductase [Beutenbergiaceae bacterium]
MAAIRVGLIGAGGIARRHLPAWLALGAEVLVYSHQGAHSITAEFGGRVADSLDGLLEGSDLITVLTPTPSHHHYASTALREGKDVVCEKPMTRHHQEAVELVRLAHQQGRHLFPAHVVRFRDQYAQMHSAVTDGRIGTPAVSRFTRTAPFPTWSPWFADYEQSGGPVLDVMVHDLDIARWVNGEVS